MSELEFVLRVAVGVLLIVVGLALFLPGIRSPR